MLEPAGHVNNTQVSWIKKGPIGPPEDTKMERKCVNTHHMSFLYVQMVQAFLLDQP